MSRHHMLMPVVYTPQVKPKKIEPKKSRIQMYSAGSADGSGETGETFETDFPRLPPLQNFTPVEGTKQKPQQPQGRLSESVLKVMLQAQELKQGFA